jgi:predicted nucleic acid-binding protein
VIALDASVLIGHLRPHDAHHAAATEILLNAAPGSMIVHPLTLAEVLVGGVRVGRGQAMRDDLKAAGIRVVAPDAGEPLRLAELRVSTGLKLPDCCVLDVALRSDSSLATFDDALAEGARRRGVPCCRDQGND